VSRLLAILAEFCRLGLSKYAIILPIDIILKYTAIQLSGMRS